MPATQPETDHNKTIERPIGIREHCAPWGDITLEVVENGMKVNLLSIKPSKNLESPVTKKMFYKALKEMAIMHGILPEAIKDNQDALFHHKGWQGSLPIAIGSRPKKKIEIDFHIFKAGEAIEIAGDTWNIGNKELSFSVMKQYFEIPGLDIERLKSTNFLVKALPADKLIATQQDIGQKANGRDIYNQIIPPLESKTYTAGENVRLENNNFFSECFGYLLITDNCITVIPPIKISDDSMKAAFINLNQIPPRVLPTPIDMTTLLRTKGIKSGESKKNIDKLCRALSEKKAAKATYVAFGVHPIPGKDAEINIFKEDSKNQPQEDLAADVIDYHELNLFHSVEEGELIAEKIFATDGTKGKTLLDEEIDTTDGEDQKLTPKSGIRVEEKNDRLLLYAETSGIVSTTGSDISVNPLCKINGDIDFSVGNIDIDKDLHVTGSVLSDFTVKAEGNAQIDGMLEPGSKLTIHGNAEIKQGIIGKDTEVIVLGDLHTSFIQEATVTVKGNLFVKSHIYNAHVTTVGQITVAGKGSGKMTGSITGGSTTASSDITALICGSPSNIATEFTLRVAPKKTARLKKLEKAIQYCDINITKIMRTLQLSKITDDNIRKLLQGVSAKKKELYITILKRLNILVKQKTTLEEEQGTLKMEVKEDLAKIGVVALKNFYGASKVTIGKYSFMPRQDEGPSKFKLVANKIIKDQPTDASSRKSRGMYVTQD